MNVAFCSDCVISYWKCTRLRRNNFVHMFWVKTLTQTYIVVFKSSFLHPWPELGSVQLINVAHLAVLVQDSLSTLWSSLALLLSNADLDENADLSDSERGMLVDWVFQNLVVHSGILMRNYFSGPGWKCLVNGRGQREQPDWFKTRQHMGRYCKAYVINWSSSVFKL